MYSIVEAAAVRYGDQVYEFNNEIMGYPKHYFSGEEVKLLPIHGNDSFKVTTRLVQDGIQDLDVRAVYVHFDIGRDRINIDQFNQ